MKLWKYGNGRVLATLVVSILAYLHTSTFAYSASLDAAVWREWKPGDSAKPRLVGHLSGVARFVSRMRRGARWWFGE